MIAGHKLLLGSYMVSARNATITKQGRPPRNSEKGAVRYGWASAASQTTLSSGRNYILDTI